MIISMEETQKKQHLLQMKDACWSLLSYFRRRGQGHTTLINKVVHEIPSAIVIVKTHDQRILYPSCKRILAIADLPGKLVGYNGPVFIDNDALSALLEAALARDPRDKP